MNYYIILAALLSWQRRKKMQRPKQSKISKLSGYLRAKNQFCSVLVWFRLVWFFWSEVFCGTPDT